MAPKPVAGEPRTKTFAVRVLTSEEVRYRATARKMRLTLSQWIRLIADQASKPE